MFVYDTVTAAIQGLKERGYTKDFNLRENSIVCDEEIKYHPEDFEIVEVYRFEGNTDPADEAVVYAIESNQGDRGVLVSGYGISADEMGSEMAKKLSMHLHDR
ncbi:MAG: phosphoribosylpyrophosphate synthetase [Bacteroidetes bacterium]|nr:MAG: phosphoribosylpyrophosphate synthetase [Bacteroidota bacterium]